MTLTSASTIASLTLTVLPPSYMDPCDDRQSPPDNPGYSSHLKIPHLSPSAVHSSSTSPPGPAAQATPTCQPTSLFPSHILTVLLTPSSLPLTINSHVYPKKPLLTCVPPIRVNSPIHQCPLPHLPLNSVNLLTYQGQATHLLIYQPQPSSAPLRQTHPHIVTPNP